MMTIIVLVALMAIAMKEMSEVPSSTSFAMEESPLLARMILNNNNNKSSTKFFMKETTKTKGCHALTASTMNQGRRRTFSGRRTKEIVNSKVKVKGGSLVWWEKQDKKGEFSFLISLLISHGKWWK